MSLIMQSFKLAPAPAPEIYGPTKIHRFSAPTV
jgi:hypothetical protein